MVVSLFSQSFAVNMVFKNFGFTLKRFDCFSTVYSSVSPVILLLMTLFHWW